MHKRKQLGKVVGYHLVIAGASEQVPFYTTHETLSTEYVRHVDKHRDIFVLIKTSFGELNLQKMPFNDLPKIDCALLADIDQRSVWRPATEKDIHNYHHHHNSES